MAKRSALTRKPSATPVGRDMVYTGGSKDFNEVTGKYGSSGRGTPPPTRLSPGVFRDSQGRLVGQGGRPLQQQPPVPQQPPQSTQQPKGPARDSYFPLPQPPTSWPPSPSLPPMARKPLLPDYTGGTGDYNRLPGGMGGSMGQQRPGLEQMARSRAEAIARGDMVTADYDPEREALVEQYLQQMGQAPVGGAIGAGRGNPVGGMGSGMGNRRDIDPGYYNPEMPVLRDFADPRTRSNPQYEPGSIAFPSNNPSATGNGGRFGLAESIASQAKARMAQNAGRFQPGSFAPYNRKPIPG